MDLENENWHASTDALSKKEHDEIIKWLEENAEITNENGIKKYYVPIERAS